MNKCSAWYSSITAKVARHAWQGHALHLLIGFMLTEGCQIFHSSFPILINAILESGADKMNSPIFTYIRTKT